MQDPRQEIKDKLDIVDVLMEYLPLKNAGSGSFRTTCPFHAEKTPSFYVSREKQIWHCFGCGTGGDMFSFIMQIDGLDFPDALRILAEKAGVEVARYTSEKTNTDHRLLAIHDLAASFYAKVLESSPQAEAARSYVKSRQIPVELVGTFRLGYAPSDWNSLSSFLERRGFSASEIVQAGLALKKKSGQGIFDRFRERIMVPLCDPQGKCVGFTGRLIGEVQKGQAKYMNSPETPIYHKSDVLFGFHLAKQDARQKKAMIVVEGNLDVIASHKVEVCHVVASSGTALTSSQLNRLKRIASTLIFSFDADAAGFDAAQRGIKLARAEGFDVRVASLPTGSGKDPDEVIQKDPQVWLSAIENTIPIIEYYLKQATKGRDLSKVDNKRHVSQMILPELMEIEDVIEREHWLRVVADLLATDINVLRDSLKNSKKSISGEVVETRKIAESKAIPKRASKERQAALMILGGWIQGIVDLTMIDLQAKWTLALPDDDLINLYKTLIIAYDLGKSDPSAQKSIFLWIRNRIEAEHTHLLAVFDEAALLGERTLSTIPQNKARDLIEDLLQTLESSYKRTQRERLMAEIRAAEACQDAEAVTRLIGEFNTWR